MAVRRPDEGEVLLLLRHTPGEPAAAVVERIDPDHARAAWPRRRSCPPDPCGPAGSACTADGGVHVVFGDHAHRLDADARGRGVAASCRGPGPTTASSRCPTATSSRRTSPAPVRASRWPPRNASRASCSCSTRDASRSSTGSCSPSRRSPGCRPTATRRTSSATRASSSSSGTGGASRSTPTAPCRYRTMDGQGYGWDCVIAGGCGVVPRRRRGQRRPTAGTLRGQGVATAPLHLVRIDLADGVAGHGRGVRPARGPRRQPAGGRRRARHRRGLRQRQRRARRVRHQRPSSRAGGASRTTAATSLLYEARGELVTGDHADVVVLDVATGAERARVDTGSGHAVGAVPAAGRRPRPLRLLLPRCQPGGRPPLTPV